MKIILIVADTFRYDHIGSNGMIEVNTPEIDELIKDSVFFNKAYAGSFPTVPHRFDMLTGNVGFPYRGWEAIGPKDITLAEIFMDYGYVTQLIADTTNIVRKGINYDRGYIAYHLIRGQERDIYFTKMNEPFRYIIPASKARDTYYFGDHPTGDLSQWQNSHWRWEEDRFAAQTVQWSAKWIEANYKEDNFLLHVDLFDPHEPWDPPEFFVDKYADPNYDGAPMIFPNYGKADVFTPEELHNMNARYKAEVEMVSKWIGYLIRKIKDVGIYDDSLIIFTSDHGIYIGEHNRTGKLNISKNDNRGPWPLYDELLHIPLAVKMPGQKHMGERVDALVQPADLLPTILDIAGIDADAKLPAKSLVPEREVVNENPGILHGRQEGLNDFDGKSLMPIISGKTEDWGREYVFSAQRIGTIATGGIGGMSVKAEEQDDILWATVTGSGFTLLLGGKKEDPAELYDLSKDPKQQKNALAENRETAGQMAGALSEFLSAKGVATEIIDAYQAHLRLV